jgi:branched-chain amino acid aminotransferase
MYYTKDTVLFLNGKFIKAVDAHTDLYSQTLHYGIGAFEGIRAYQTLNGTKLFKAYEHFERLKKSCALVNIPFQYETDELIQIAYQLLEKMICQMPTSDRWYTAVQTCSYPSPAKFT